MKNKIQGNILRSLVNGGSVFIALIALACGSADSLNKEGDLTYSVTFAGHNNLRLAEGETESVSYKVRLSDKPSSNVTLELNADASQIEVLPARLSFGPSDWSNAKTVQLTANDDTLIEGDHSAEIEHAISSEDPNYSGGSPGIVNAIISDNDSAGFYIFPSSQITVDEGDTSGVSYSVFLTHEPKSDVVVSLSVDASSQVSLSKSELVFSSLAWDEPQQVIVTANDDFAIESDSENQAVITHSIFSADGDFQELADQDLMVQITDNDSVVYVDGRSPVNGDGTSWSTAYNNLQTALNNVYSGQEIWVAADTYIPDTTGDRSQSFVLIDGVNIYGGFAGTETARSQADPGANPTILSGDLDSNDHLSTISDNSYRVVTAANLGLSGTVTFAGFIVQGGNADDGTINTGAGVYIFNSDIKLDEMIIRNNSSADDGAGIYSTASDLNIEDSTIEYNSSGDHAGAIMSLDNTSLRITSSIIDSNTAADDGGALWLNHLGTANAGVYFESVTFTNNTAGDIGGGMYFRYADNTTLLDVHFGTQYTLDGSDELLTSDGNHAQGDVGGAAYINSVDGLDITNSSFVGNTSVDRGGALYLSSNTDVVFSSSNVASFRSHFTYNKTMGNGSPAGPETSLSGAGGAVWLFGGTPDLTVTGVDFVGNAATGTAQAFGGGLYIDGETGLEVLTVTDSKFLKNKAQGNGGGIYATVLSATITDSTFNENEGVDGGGVHSADNESLRILDSSFDGNVAVEDGGGLYVKHENSTGDGSVFLEGLVFTNNVTDTYAGGGVFLQYTDNSLIKDVEFGTSYTVDGSENVIARDGNTAQGVGGGLYMNNVDNIEFIDSTWKANKAYDRGGGLYFSTCTGVIFRSSLPDNFRSSFEYNFTEASGGTGVQTVGSGAAGAIYGYNGPPDMTILSTDFIGNKAAGTIYAAGGAILFDADANDYKLDIDDSRFERNDAQGRGGAIYLDGVHNINITRSDFVENKGEHGGPIQLYDCNGCNLYANTYINNEATGGHGGAIIGYGDDSAEVSYSLFYGNHAATFGGAITFDFENSGDIFYVRNSTFVANTTTAATAGGVFGLDAAYEIRAYNNIFYRNESSGTANHIQVAAGTYTEDSNEYIDDGEAHPFVNDTDDPDTFNFRLDLASPIIATFQDASNETYVENEYFKDLDGYQRTTNASTDLGAYETGGVGVTVSPLGSLQVSENGSSASFTVVLTAAPTDDVTISVTSNDTSEVTVDESSLLFTSSNWNTPQTVTVTGVADSAVDYDKSIQINLGPITSLDANYSGFEPDFVLVQVDNID